MVLNIGNAPELETLCINCGKTYAEHYGVYCPDNKGVFLWDAEKKQYDGGRRFEEAKK